MNKVYTSTRLDHDIFHTIESVVEYVNNNNEIADVIAANYAFNACKENGFGFSKDEAQAHLEFLAEAGAKFDKYDALNLFEQAVNQNKH